MKGNSDKKALIVRKAAKNDPPGRTAAHREDRNVFSAFLRRGSEEKMALEIVIGLPVVEEVETQFFSV